MKIILFLIILTFFLPFFTIYFDAPLLALLFNAEKVTFSGFEAALEKRTEAGFYQEGSPLLFILAAAPVIMLIFIFLFKAKQSLLFKNIFIAAPIFNIFAGITVIFIARILTEKKIADSFGDFNMRNIANFIYFRPGYGLILYIILNAVLLAVASVSYFKDIKKD